ncbi:MAG: DUF3467 domain-containing protein [Candidatus Cryptobacteroides sp.]|nr:DUF3467 domain-containing protein [Bacteroidales bacterium]MDY6157867.1 DUF3467 domain-containing protein [Candidatus Cryptobacteroides sp.]
MDNDKKPLGRLEVLPEAAGGTYSNLAVISHSKNEFLIDFATMFPGFQGPQVRSRIIMAPEHCKRLLGALAENIGKYESQFGEISLDNKPATFNISDLNNNGPKS